MGVKGSAVVIEESVILVEGSAMAVGIVEGAAMAVGGSAMVIGG